MRQRRHVLALLAAASLVAPERARSQRSGLLIGVLSPLAPETAASNIKALREGFSDLGYVEGRGLTLAPRYLMGRTEHAPQIITEMVALKPDAIVVGGTTATLHASKVTRSVPLVMLGVSDDPVT